MQLAQAILFVHDAAAMQAFYESLGLRVLDGSAADGFVRLSDPTGGAILALHHTKAIGPNTEPRTDTAVKLCFHVTDVDAERAVLVARSIRMRDTHRFGAIVFCDGIDPEGDVFQLTTR
jgi:catechol 2,3-dioxygenase-like lactoylglutathione lyase family enzyme